MRFEIGERVAFVQPVTGFVALKPQAAAIEAFESDENMEFSSRASFLVRF